MLNTLFSQCVIGARPPSRATVSTERRPIPQEFTNSFNNVKYTDQVRDLGDGLDCCAQSTKHTRPNLVLTIDLMISPSTTTTQHNTQSLNCTITRSKIHKALDPQFL